MLTKRVKRKICNFALNKKRNFYFKTSTNTTRAKKQQITEREDVNKSGNVKELFCQLFNVLHFVISLLYYITVLPSAMTYLILLD